ncbi:MAG: LD-carboxypeptidase [Lachnospiraceae bacterium]|nr:LD-carboxypeptidase [Lachnospiraceae bacterium]
MKYPKSLQKGGCIGFPAPSFGCATEPYYSAFQNGLKKWQELGYQTNPGENAYANCGVGISNNPENCGQELTNMYLDRKNDILISCGGGELMCEILDYVDFESITKAEPKWFVGYSDNTNMTYLLATICDTASVYGPCAGTYGMEPWHESLWDVHALLTGEKTEMTGYATWEKESLKSEENPLAPYHTTEPRALKVWDGYLWQEAIEQTPETITMSGRILGGCMDCLINLIGTEYDKTAEFIEKYKEDGILWFIEACELNVFSIRRAMWQMEHAGWFRHVKGFVFGRPRNGESMMGLDEYEAVLAVAGKYHVPVIMDADMGHLPPMIPLVIGSLADVTVQGNDMKVKMNLI